MTTRRLLRTRRAPGTGHLATFLVLLLMLLAINPARSQSDLGNDEESMFDAPIMEEQQEADSAERDFSRELLTQEETRIGGRYSFRLAPRLYWDELDGLSDDADQAEYAFDTYLETVLYIDARPTSNFRVYGEAEITYPFTVDSGGESGSSPARSFSDIVRITELFSDFVIGDSLFVRAGKSTVTWGVGHFFSPADVINLERIDPDDPEADREGPLNLRTQYTSGTTNLYLYLLPPVGDERYPAVAPRAEIVVDAFELGAGGYWRYGQDPVVMLTAEGSLGDVSLFGEAVLLYGTDRRYVREAATPLGVEVYTRDEPQFNGTVGARYRYSWPEEGTSLTVAGQYFYNGEGYADASVLTDNRTAVMGLVASGELSRTDLARTGRHYAAASASVDDILDSDVSLRALWYANLSDGSGRASTTASYRVNDNASVSIGPVYTYGATGAEFTLMGPRLDLELSFAVSGRF